MRKTKIICTMGPATDNIEVLRAMARAGMNVARFNFSHGSHEEHKQRIDRVKAVREEYNLPIALLLDTKGPEIRTGDMQDGKIFLKKGEQIRLTPRACLGTPSKISITYPDLYQDVQAGTSILIDDGLIELRVEQTQEQDILCRVLNDGAVSNHKGINVPDVHLSIPYLSDKDKSDIQFGIEQGVDFIAASFVRTADDVQQLRMLLDENGGAHINIIAKIENQQGVENIDGIVSLADGVMIARGDMGVEIPAEDVPPIQKMLIKKVASAGKQVITATQMLDSMMKNPRPTRAEVTDVANAIYDGTGAIMLSGETAAGLYPVEAVTMMARIAERTENDIDYRKRFFVRTRKANPDITDAICHATCTTAYDLNARDIVTVTKSGRSARMVARYRPSCGIIGCTPTKKVWYQLNLAWGVTPVLLSETDDVFDLFDSALETAKNQGLMQSGDLAVITSGVPIGVSGTTNMIRVQVVK
ncbi:pyruvate kinase [Butyricicoccus intestinisimiae]|uniref:Pyruvate kinase n=1 Tax=Butyricicoccus intestinisimiae TaxID=2841509 RepID=A0ABS6EU32_9FIRM|nr:pyruvate kinase [Butyricicoccus intestinisimiae]MBU5491183.1 pyruvate kinase [Butyricicoccus intestinisimiae]MCI6325828.1 pyruvate kinase [Clostridiales bacterium]